MRTGNNQDWDPPYTSHHVYIGRNHFHHNGENAIDLKIMADVVYSQNVMHDFEPSVSSGGYAVTVHYDPPNNWVMFNTIYNASHGIAVHGVVDFYAIGNEIFDISGRGIVFWANGEVHIVGNTISNVDDGIYTWIPSTEPHPIINNIVHNINDPTNGWHIRYSQESLADASDMHHNLVYQDNGPIRINWHGEYNSILDFQNGTGKCQGCVEADPLFVDHANDDYRLQAGSLAKDAGTAEISYYQLYEDRFGVGIRSDLVDTPRPQGDGWDIGAYEYVQPGPVLELDGASGDETIYLIWQVTGTLPTSTTWRISYTDQGDSTMIPAMSLISTTQIYTLTSLTNNLWYTVTLNGMLGETFFLTDTVRVMPLGPELRLYAAPGNGTVYLDWEIIRGTMPVTGAWRIGYESDTGTVQFPATEIPTSTVRSHTLVSLTNGVWYTVRLNAMVNSTPILTDTARVMLTNKFVYLPIVLRMN
ncbi:MAG: right-handed parallel beta-helix repeat-containing protein [Chloroflexi bacterium]|nr:right-handed parallel beta-helix repeat-containing protein [Chloroflexota bacterium]